MKILVSTKNIVRPCGEKFLAKDRIIALSDSTFGFYPKIYKTVEDYNRDIEEKMYIYRENIHNHFRDANEEEEKAFYAGVKCLETSKA
jgi:hypothetical protein